MDSIGRGSSRSGGSPSHLCSTFIDQLLVTGFLDKHIVNVLQPAYAERYHILTSAIQEHLVPRGVSVKAPPSTIGGYFIWLTLPDPLRATDVVRRAQEEEKLRLAPGDLFQVAEDSQTMTSRFGGNLRLCFAWEEAGHLIEGVRRLARVLDRMA